MNNTILAGIIVGGVVVAAASAIAVNSGYNPFQKYATVVSVAQAQAAETPPEAPAAAKDDRNTVPQCLTVFDTASVEAGFDATYELDGIQKVVRLDREPGRRIPVEDGELVLSQS